MKYRKFCVIMHFHLKSGLKVQRVSIESLSLWFTASLGRSIDTMRNY